MKIETEDFTKLENFVEYYLQEYNSHKNKVIAARLDADLDCYTLLNPAVKPKNPHNPYLIPELKTKILQEKHYFLTLQHLGDITLGLYFKETQYGQKIFGERRLPFSFDIINEIDLFLIGPEHITEPGEKIKIRPHEYKKAKLHDYYIFEEAERSGKKVFYAFDIPWDEALKIERYKVPPEILFMNAFAFHNNDESAKYNLIMNLDLIYKYLINYCDTSVLKYVTQREIPSIAFIWKRYFIDRVEIDDESLDKINEITPLNKLYLTNALNFFVSRLCFGIVYDLAVTGKFLVCGYCWKVIRRHWHNQKYCTMMYEGRDCGKKRRNKKYYKENRDKILQYYKGEMRITRNWEKSRQDKSSS